MAVSSINTIVKDIIAYNAKNQVHGNIESALRSIQKARRALQKEYSNFLFDTVVMNKKLQLQNEIDKMPGITESQLIQQFNETMSFHRSHVYAYRLQNTDISSQIDKKWEIYNSIKEQYRQKEKLKSQIYSSPAKEYQNSAALEQAMITAMVAIEKARNCFQDPIPYSIAFVDDMQNNNIVKEGQFTLQELIKSNSLSLSISSGTGSFESSLGISLKFNRSIMNSSKLNSLNKKDAEWIMTQGGNRGLAYENILGQKPQGVKSNTVWSAAPDVITKMGTPLQAKFIGFSSWGSAILRVSSLNSILVSLTTYETLLQASMNKKLDPNLDVDSLYQQFIGQITKSLQKKYL